MTKKHVYLFQPQYSVEFRKENNYWLPYSAGCIWSYCLQHTIITDNYVLKDLIFKREPHENILSRLDNPVVCGFSCYQWNKNYNLTLAKKIKDKWPNCIIVFGGPEVTVTFLTEPFVDSVVLAEGEQAFLDILERRANNKPVLQEYKKQRLENLNYPSPYTTGVFDQLIENNPGVKWATTLETNRGCPFSCTFCDWGSVTYSKVRRFNLDRVAADLDWIATNPISYIFCADANFGIFKERDLEIAKLVAATSKRSSTLEVFNATFNKNNNEWSFEILKELGDLNRGFTVSVQSLYAPTLKAIKRDNLGINDLEHIFDLCDKHNISSYTEIILGLPLETKDTFIDGICQLLELGQHNHIDVWFTDLLVNSELANGTNKINYSIKTVPTSNYLSFHAENNSDEYMDQIDIVNSTNTMSTKDMIESYMYAWLIVNFHVQGYSQLSSRICRYQFQISYKDFYNRLLDAILKDEILGNIYKNTKLRIEDFLYNGQLAKNTNGHNLIFYNGNNLYKNKDRIFAVLNTILDSLSDNGHINDLKNLQKFSIFDYNTQYPITVDYNFNLNTRLNVSTQYVFDKKLLTSDISISTESEFKDYYYTLRRKGLLKNKVTQI